MSHTRKSRTHLPSNVLLPLSSSAAAALRRRRRRRVPLLLLALFRNSSDKSISAWSLLFQRTLFADYDNDWRVCGESAPNRSHTRDGENYATEPPRALNTLRVRSGPNTEHGPEVWLHKIIILIMRSIVYDTIRIIQLKLGFFFFNITFKRFCADFTHGVMLTYIILARVIHNVRHLDDFV